MASNLFGRYVWLLDTLQTYGKLTYEDINRLWKDCRLGFGDDLPKRTFHSHRAAILDIFGVDIQCDTNDGYKYFIFNPEDLEKDSLRSWLIDSYSMMNQVHADEKLKDRIIFENVPSGRIWLTAITSAIRLNKVIRITYRKFSTSEDKVHEIEPHYLKMNKLRWYIIAKTASDKFLTFALDRIVNVEETDKTFRFDKDFDIKEHYKGCCGVMPANGEPIRVVIKAVEETPDYLRSLPLHESQRELTELAEDEATYFEYHVCPNFEFYQALFSSLDLIEVIEPESVRKEMRKFAKSFMSYYNTL